MPCVTMVIQRLRPYFSGQGVQVEEVCRELARRGVDVTVVTAVRGRHPAWEQVNGYRVRRLRCDIPGIPISARRTRFWVPVFGLRTFLHLWRHRRSIDIVHVHTLSDALYAARLFSRLTGKPVVFEMTLLGADDPLSVQSSRNHLRRARYASYRRCAAYVAISPALAERYQRAGLPMERLRVIPQGVDTDRFSPAEHRGVLREQLGLPTGVPLVISVGSLIERKGIDLLLSAWQQLHAAHPDAHLVLVGKNRFADDLAAQRFLDATMEALGPDAARHVHQVGVVDNVEDFLRAADLFLFASRREGFGTVMIEAMACGLPCVVCDLPGITDTIFSADGGDGVVVPTQDVGAIVAAAEHFLSDRSRAVEVGRAARARAIQLFSLVKICDSYLELYSELLRAGGPLR